MIRSCETLPNRQLTDSKGNDLRIGALLELTSQGPGQWMTLSPTSFLMCLVE